MYIEFNYKTMFSLVFICLKTLQMKMSLLTIPFVLQQTYFIISLICNADEYIKVGPGVRNVLLPL